MDNSERGLDARQDKVEPADTDYSVQDGAESWLHDAKPETHDDDQHPDIAFIISFNQLVK